MFYSMPNSQNKICNLKYSPNHAVKIFKWPFCTKEMLYFAHWKSNKQWEKIGYEAFNEYSADKLSVAYIFEKVWVSGQGCKLRDIGQNIKILVKTKVDFIQTPILYVNFSQKVLCKKCKNCFEILFEPCCKCP